MYINEMPSCYVHGNASTVLIEVSCPAIRVKCTNINLDEFLCFKEALQVPHLPYAHQNEDDGLTQRPPQYPRIGTVTHLSETLFTLLQSG